MRFFGLVFFSKTCQNACTFPTALLLLKLALGSGPDTWPSAARLKAGCLLAQAAISSLSALFYLWSAVAQQDLCGWRVR